MSLPIKILWENLENHSKDDLCDIYWNLVDGTWDRRIGRKPIDFDLLPYETKRKKKRSKNKILEPYIQEIERMTNKKERRRYLMVEIQKCLTSSEFEEWWTDLEKSGVKLSR